MAASFALEAEKAPLHAVQLLELGRGIITSLRSRLWTDVTELSEYHPQIAESGAEGDPLGSKPKRNDRHQASFDLDDTIGQIRLLPGFEKFLHPPPVEVLNSAASTGPIVLINSSVHRSDAILIEKTAI
ncbi:hypothetical protein BFJ69_g13502 [Fusarium oxysporum]|uniref:Uncharacterized protein n=1 Tax=Fusarium oxysporum TaxID=5507 RepID=A0A420MKK6_FUSOX|nr:hypothetical protein BFJ69_g13502 [Fusarium oxysporum]